MHGDHQLFHWVVTHRAGALDPLFVALTTIAIGGWLWLALALLAARLRHRSLLHAGLVAVTAVWGADAVSYLIKAVVARPRPFVAYPRAHLLIARPGSASFPSSHATTAFAGAVVLAYLAPKAAPAAFVLASLIAFSRVYVGVHYPADVIAGALIGTAVAALAVQADRAGLFERGIHRLRPHTGKRAARAGRDGAPPGRR